MQTVGLHSFRLTRQDAATVLRTWIPLNTLPRPVVCQWGWSLFGRNPSHHIIPSLLILFASLSSFLLLLFLFSFCFLFLFFPFLPSFFMLLFFLYNSFQTYVVFIFDCGTCALLGCPPRVQPNETHGQMCTLHRRGNALSLSLFAWCVCVVALPCLVFCNDPQELDTVKCNKDHDNQKSLWRHKSLRNGVWTLTVEALYVNLPIRENCPNLGHSAQLYIYMEALVVTCWWFCGFLRDQGCPALWQLLECLVVCVCVILSERYFLNIVTQTAYLVTSWLPTVSGF